MCRLCRHKLPACHPCSPQSPAANSDAGKSKQAACHCHVHPSCRDRRGGLQHIRYFTQAPLGCSASPTSNWQEMPRPRQQGTKTSSIPFNSRGSGGCNLRATFRAQERGGGTGAWARVTHLPTLRRCQPSPPPLPPLHSGAA